MYCFVYHIWFKNVNKTFLRISLNVLKIIEFSTSFHQYVYTVTSLDQNYFWLQLMNFK